MCLYIYEITFICSPCLLPILRKPTKNLDRYLDRIRTYFDTSFQPDSLITLMSQIRINEIIANQYVQLLKLCFPALLILPFCFLVFDHGSLLFTYILNIQLTHCAVVFLILICPERLKSQVSSPESMAFTNCPFKHRKVIY